MSYTVNLSKLKNACDFCLDVDEKNGKVILKGSCTVKDTEGKKHTYKNQIDLVPIIRVLLDRVRNVEASIGGPLSLTIEHSGGWLSDTWGKITRTAKSIGENRIAKTIYNDVLPDVAEYVPGGTLALDIADKAADIVSNARDGSKGAISKVHAVAEAAKDGSSPAKQVLSVMTAMNRMLEMKVRYHEFSGGEVIGRETVRLRRTPTPWAPGISPNRPPRKRPTRSSAPRSTVRPGTRDQRTQPPPAPQDPYSQDPYAQDPYTQDPYSGYYPQDPYAGYYADPYAGYGLSPSTPQPNPLMNDPAYRQYLQAQGAYYDDEKAKKDAYFESLFAGPDPDPQYDENGEYVQGWLYNRPYRDPITMMQHINRDPGFVMRYLYKSGLEQMSKR